MITHDNVVNFLKNSLTTYFNTVNDGKYSDFADNMDIYEESSYNSNKDIIITLQFLKGSTQLGFTDLPINVIFEVIEGKATNGKTIANQVMDLVNSFIEDYNDTSAYMIDDDGNEYVVTQYYSSTNAIGNGQNRGTNKYKAFTMDMRLIAFENGYYQALQDSSITFNNVENTPKLVNILEITSHITHTQEAYVSGTSPKQNLVTTGIQYNLSVTFIATKTNGLHIKLANEAKQDVKYNITHNGFVTRTANMKVIDYNESTPYADVMKVQITFSEV